VTQDITYFPLEGSYLGMDGESQGCLNHYLFLGLENSSSVPSYTVDVSGVKGQRARVYTV